MKEASPEGIAVACALRRGGVRGVVVAARTGLSLQQVYRWTAVDGAHARRARDREIVRLWREEKLGRDAIAARLEPRLSARQVGRVLAREGVRRRRRRARPTSLRKAA